jgi:hypothetical protein
VPGTTVLVFCWIGIFIAAGTSVTFNINHDTSWLHSALAAIAGFTPPALAAVLAHVASAFEEKYLKAGVFIVCAGAMAVSAIGTTKTLEPGDGFFGGLGFSLVADSASMLCLLGLIKIYDARARLIRWLAAQDTGTTGPAQNQPAADSRPVVLEPAAGTSGPEPTAVPGTVAAPVEPAARTAPADPVGAPAAPAGEIRPHVPAKATAAKATAPGEPGEDRDMVVADIVARGRPVLEDAVAQQRRDLEILREFRARTGKRMNNAEFGRALGISKAEAGTRRQAVADKEAA